MTAKKGMATIEPVEVVARDYATQEGSDVALEPAELTPAQIAQRRRDRARAEELGVLGPLRAEDLDIAEDVDVDALEDERRKREAWERKKRQMAREKAKRLASQGRIPPIAGHLEQVIQGIFGAADERWPVSAEDEPRLRAQDRWVAKVLGEPDPYGDDEPLSPMTPFEERQQILEGAEEKYKEEQPIIEEVHGDARNEVSREFAEEHPDLKDAAFAIESESDNAPRYAAAIENATDIWESPLHHMEGQPTAISFTDRNGNSQHWVYDRRDDTLSLQVIFPAGE